MHYRGLPYYPPEEVPLFNSDSLFSSMYQFLKIKGLKLLTKKKNRYDETLGCGAMEKNIDGGIFVPSLNKPTFTVLFFSFSVYH